MNEPIASYVVRFHASNSEGREGNKTYRIKVTHVQKEQEEIFDTFEEAMGYMKNSIGETDSSTEKGAVPWTE